MTNNAIAFQGAPGAYSHLACKKVRPDLTPLPCRSFAATFEAVKDGRAIAALVPVENSTAGRVADIHHLLPEHGLPIVAEHFQEINHCLVAPHGASIDTIQEVYSHVQALSQCRKFLKANNLEPVVHADTAGAAADIAAANDPTKAAIASVLAAEIYNLKVIQPKVEDNHDNTTRFCLVSQEPNTLSPDDGKLITTLVFRMRSVPAALYKALGGFATNGVNLTKLESYIVDGKFRVAQFYADIEGHPEHKSVQLALEELAFFAVSVKILGTYPASPFRVPDM